MTNFAEQRHTGSRRLWCMTVVLGFVSLICGILLGGLSVWFLSSVALAGLSVASLTFNFHIPGALVRLFAFGRTAARYGERLVGHEAALNDQNARRIALFSRMAEAPAPRRVGWQLAGQSRLTEYLDDVEDIDFASLRADLPGVLLGLGIMGAAMATAALTPLALIPIFVLLAFVGVFARRLAKRSEQVWSRARKLRRAGAGDLGDAMAAAVPLQAEGAWARRSAAALDQLSQADKVERGIRIDQAVVEALAGLLGPLAALSVVLAAWSEGWRHEALLIPVFLAFGWFTLVETVQGVPRIVIARLRRKMAHAELARWTPSTQATDRSATTAAVRLRWLRGRNIQRLAPNGRALGEPLTLKLRAGCPVAISGVSGIGKTSLLKQVAGWLGEDIFDSDIGSLAAADREALSMLSLHDAAVLCDTVRDNLFAPDSTDTQYWQALDDVELADRIRAGGGLDGWIGQDSLSLGEAQRLNLARAWLSQKPIILLDEPMEHLPAEQAWRILERLLSHLQDRVIIMASHKTIGGRDTLNLIL